MYETLENAVRAFRFFEATENNVAVIQFLSFMLFDLYRFLYIKEYLFSPLGVIDYIRERLSSNNNIDILQVYQSNTKRS